MKLQGRNLSAQMQGEDVKLLQGELCRLGYKVADAETAKGLFGETTRRAVLEFQKGQGLSQDGVVGENTARLLSFEVSRLQRQPTGGAPQPSGSVPLQPGDGGTKPQPDVAPKLFVIQGQVRQRDGKPAAGLTVRAFDRNGGGETLLGEAVSDQSGQYKITYTEDVFRKLIGNRSGLDMIMRAFDPPHNTHAEWNVVRITQPVETFDREIQWLPWTKPEPQPEPKPFCVKGQVRWFDGRQAVTLTVRAFDKDLRSEELLGATSVDKDGRYEITYGPEQFRRAEKRSADLIVRVVDQKDSLVSVSPVIFNAAPIETVDLVLGGKEYKGPSEFEEMTAQLTPVLQAIKPAELTDEDLVFLTGETGIETRHLESFALAHRFALKTGLPAEFFYGLLRQGIPAESAIKALGLTRQPQKPLEEREPPSLLNQSDRALDALVLTDAETVERALQVSIKQNIAPQRLSETLDGLKARWEEYRSQHSTDSTVSPSLRPAQLLQLTELKQSQHAAFIKLYQDKGSARDFWEQVEQSPGIGQDLTREIEATFMLAELFDGDLQLVSDIKSLSKGFSPADVKGLAKLDSAGWEQVLNERIKRGPQQMSVAKESQADTQSRASMLADKFEQAFPTAAFLGRLEKDERSRIAGREAVVEFLNQHPDLELLSTDLDHYFTDQHEQLRAEAGDDSGLKQSLKAIQRVFKLAPSYKATQALLSKNISSAQQVYFKGADQFSQSVNGESGIDKEQARQIYRRAEQTYAASLALAGEIRSLVNGSAVRSLPDTQTHMMASGLSEKIPNWESLFTSAALCECEHCRSVYSPASYMVDMLRFLKERNSTTTAQSVRDVLFKRRPDIGEIELTCENTNEALPYIDLVCEILEDAVATASQGLDSSLETQLKDGVISGSLGNEFNKKGLPLSEKAEVIGWGKAGPWTVRDEAHTYKVVKNGSNLQAFVSRQTHGTAAELQAQPEYVTFAAYDKLKGATFPMALPFDLYWDEARAYLSKVKVTRREAMLLFQNPADAGSNQPQALDIAAEFLGLNKREAAIIITANPGAQQPLWGSINDIEDVSAFLEKTGLEYEQLLELLDLTFVNPNHVSDIVHLDDSCDLHMKMISNLESDPNKQDRMGRFLRLWRKVGWRMWELDRVVMCARLGGGKIDGQFLSKLASFMELKEKLGLSVEELLSFYEMMNTAGENALYQRVFLNKSLLDPVDEAFKLETDPSGASASIDGHGATFRAVLRLSAEDLKQAADATGNQLRNQGQLRLDNVTLIYRLSLLANKLELSVGDLLAAVQLLGTPTSRYDPFLDPQRTLEFISKVERMKMSGFTVKTLSYILKHSDDGSLSDVPGTSKITEFIGKLRQGLQPIKDSSETITGTAREAFIAKLGTLQGVDVKILDQALAVIDGSWGGTATERDRFISDSFASFLSSTEITEAQTRLGTTLPSDESDRQKEIDARFSFILGKLNGFFALRSSREFIAQAVAAEFGIAEELARFVLSDFQLQTETIRLVENFLTPDLLKKASGGSSYDKQINPANFQALYDGYVLLSKIGVVVKTLALTKRDVEWLEKQGATFGLLKLSALPVNSKQTAIPLEAFADLQDLLGLMAAYPDGEQNSWQQVLEKLAAQQPDSPDALSSLTGWPPDKLRALNTALGLTVDDFKRISTYLRLRDCLALLRNLDISVADVASIIKPDLGSSDLIRIKQIVKARYENREWLEVSKAIQDGVREKKRDALVAYLLANPFGGEQWKDANDLYAYYLIDVGMSACEVTTRILQANLSIQLFVQRCLMRLESEVIADAEADREWLQWKWMKLYRVWEANRKVFLYPENWLEPEFRSDKSSFFKELENDLLQNEVTHANAENAYMSYLEKLDTVARLDVCASYYEDATYTLHVFARTYDDPHVYYYRRFVEERYWTPWEKVETDIKSDHLIPLVINRRLYLYWAEFTEKAEEPDKVNPPPQNSNPVPLEKPLKYWEIRLAVSEYRNKKWTAKKVSKSLLRTPSQKELAAKNSFMFLALELAFWLGTEFPEGLPLIICVNTQFAFSSAFKLGGYGSPEVIANTGALEFLAEPIAPRYLGSQLENMESVEKADTDSSLVKQLVSLKFFNNKSGELNVLGLTHGQFRVTSANQLGFLDKWLWKKELTSYVLGKIAGINFPTPTYAVGSYMPFFYEDEKKTFFVQPQMWESKNSTSNKPERDEYAYTELLKLHQAFQQVSDNFLTAFFYGTLLALNVGMTSPGYAYGLRFGSFYHPYAGFLIKQLYLRGLDGLLSRETQLVGISKKDYPDLYTLTKAKFPELEDFSFKGTYAPNDDVVNSQHPTEEMDFEPGASYSQYNWELFFHAPLMLADRLSKNQRFEEAMRWFHYIFNPTDASKFTSPQRFWITKPFFLRSGDEYKRQRVDEIMRLISDKDKGKEFVKQIEDWRNDPFNPHLIAKFRGVSYQKNVVMKYIDNLIAWGDYLFRTDTRENINQATQLYVLAAEILGPKPHTIPPKQRPPVRNYYQLDRDLDEFGNALMDLENLVSAVEGTAETFEAPPKLPRLDSLYFCIPQNDKLLGYWDVVADRLFKIRHCQNIEGVERQLALFDPPIDPAQLIKAAAAGLDIGAVLSDINAPLSPYRYQFMIQKAQEFCGEVKALGSALLAALEKRDAEALSLLRSTHELTVLKGVRQIKEQQIKEAEDNLAALKVAQAINQERINYYTKLSNAFMNTWETAAFDLSIASASAHGVAILGDLLSGALFLIPDFNVGVSGIAATPHATAKTGGQSVGKSGERGANGLYQLAALLDKAASLSGTQGSYQRRHDEWDFQRMTAEKEKEQIQQQIAAAEIRQEIAKKDLSNQDLQIENAQAADEYLRSKFTSKELYDWMVSQISAVYFQSYQLAYDMAKKAERCFRHELGLSDSSFVQFGHWDGLKKGLLAGERLSHELRELESAYLAQNKRELEITRHISLARLDPVAFLRLKQTGKCFVKIPEALFDLDYPGHYLRRIKFVRVTIPCVTGPYTNVSCTLTALKSYIRRNTELHNNSKYAFQDDDDSRFTITTSVIQSIATSSAQNDGGLFDMNPRDERYLPFEGLGATSEWRIELPDRFRQFDYNTISDVILHFGYTARDGGMTFRQQVLAEMQTEINKIALAENQKGSAILLSVRNEFPTEWHQFLNPSSPSGDQTLSLDLGKERFPFAYQGKTLKLAEIKVLLKVKSTSAAKVNTTTLKLSLVAGAAGPRAALNQLQLKDGLLQQSFDGANITVSDEMSLKLSAWLEADNRGTHTRLDADALEELMLVCHYSLA